MQSSPKPVFRPFRPVRIPRHSRCGGSLGAPCHPPSPRAFSVDASPSTPTIKPPVTSWEALGAPKEWLRGNRSSDSKLRTPPPTLPTVRVSKAAPVPIVAATKTPVPELSPHPHPPPPTPSPSPWLRKGRFQTPAPSPSTTHPESLPITWVTEAPFTAPRPHSPRLPPPKLLFRPPPPSPVLIPRIYRHPSSKPQILPSPAPIPIAGLLGYRGSLSKLQASLSSRSLAPRSRPPTAHLYGTWSHGHMHRSRPPVSARPDGDPGLCR
ncbi:extensin-like [Trichosurus vulpecula]|uniref:extensin-like n=1 Tax=Trichosurus vulpecula TaxID=9337 RepID=UPI00186B1B18|nr:extensin-like [Trichosurus vulpecula]